MSLETDLVTRLNAIPALVAAGAKVTWFDAPGYPAVELTKIVTGLSWSHTGPEGLLNPRVRVDSWAHDPDVAKAMADALQAEFERLDTVSIGGTIFLPPGVLEADEAIVDTVGDVSGSGGDTLYRWLQEFTFFAKPAE